MNKTSLGAICLLGILNAAAISSLAFRQETPLYAIPQNPTAPRDTEIPRTQHRVLSADHSNYLALLKQLQPGDTLLLAPEEYDSPNEAPGLPIIDLNGEPDNPIIISGPAAGPAPVFVGRAGYNTVRIARSSYIVLRNLELNGRGIDVDAVKSQGISHHITIENLRIIGHGADQATVGISTKAVAWDWVIRGNVIIGAGTGMYLGNSDGAAPFVGGLIENNLILDSRGYNMEIKHQLPRPSLPGLPTSPQVTIIRHNVFGKGKNSSFGHMARPNVLVGHFPLAGDGAEDFYLIYGNFFYGNPSGEALFQGEGNIALYDNLFANPPGDAVEIRPHKAFPRRIFIFFNTVVAGNEGIAVREGADNYPQVVIGNVVLAGNPILAAHQSANITGQLRAADRILTNPLVSPGQLDLYPKLGTVRGVPVDSQRFRKFLDWNLDFNGTPRDPRFRGAYSGEGKNPGWLPQLELQPQSLIRKPPQDQ